MPEGTAHRWAVDVSDAAATEETAARVRSWFGFLSVVISNAGNAAAGPFLDSDPRLGRRVVEIKSRNAWYAASNAVPPRFTPSNRCVGYDSRVLGCRRWSRSAPVNDAAPGEGRGHRGARAPGPGQRGGVGRARRRGFLSGPDTRWGMKGLSPFHPV
ncbi:SDR family oxidoreductase [Streptomyces sp. NBC_01594]|uniref:SDR family oxidoreductase n=1 Tax=Streptomyces sp. NBC_01594 TaxID=2975890 RepID=UPI0038704735